MSPKSLVESPKSGVSSRESEVFSPKSLVLSPRWVSGCFWLMDKSPGKAVLFGVMPSKAVFLLFKSLSQPFCFLEGKNKGDGQKA